ncbi:hypothetical protein JB92DRAFT_2941923 [Gautieria morchelliformis]|nr:hypothetical protein JB92DRAFT_2941923 [Gautieria morchelliformis]
MKRSSTDSPSPSKRQQRPRTEAVAADVQAENSSSSTSADALQEEHGDQVRVRGSIKLKQFQGISEAERTCSSWVTVSDHDKGYLYVLFAKPEHGSQLFYMPTSTMEWEQISLLHRPTDVFQDPQPTLPYRMKPSIVLFGPEDHRRLLIFGGRNEDVDLTADFFCLDLVKMIWSKFVIEGGSIRPRLVASIVVVQNKLYIFGGIGMEHLDTYSVAEFSSSRNTWTWQIMDEPLGGDFGSSRLMAAPLYGGRKILITALTRNEKSSAARSLHPENVLTFDTLTHTFSQDGHGHGDFPTSLSGNLRMCSSRFPRELAFLFDWSISKTAPCPGASLWSYEPFPENRWRCIFRNMGSKDEFITDLACVGEKSYLFFSSRTRLRGYIELEKFIEDMKIKDIW